MTDAGRTWDAILDALSSPPPETIDRRDAPYLLLILASFAAGLAVSWQRWGIPLIDVGRELNVPLRLARGEMLYSDVRYIYGPFSPYVNAALYRILHPSLWVLWGRGIASTILILALVYWLARQVAGRFPATLACLGVTWLCALKPQGNYILPYAYAGLDGCAFDLATVALLLVFLRKKGLGWLFAAGVAASLVVLSKTEMGVTAIGTGVVAVTLAGYPRVQSIAARLAAFLAPALGIPAAVFEWFALRVGWHTLTNESYLFFTHVPWQLIYFNKVRFGFDHPWHSLWLMILSLARLIAVAGVLGSVSLFAARRRAGAPAATARPAGTSGAPLALFLVSSAVIAVTSLGLSDLGPFLAVPFILLALIGAGLAAFARKARESSSLGRENAAVMVILAVFALGCLPRLLLRVSTGGALSSFLVPVSVVLFVYVWLVLFPLLFSETAARRVAGLLASAVLIAGVLATAVTVSVRYHRKFAYTYALVTPRGTWRTSPDLGIAFHQALRFIETNTAADDAVAVLPEGTSLNFLSDRRNPLRNEIFTPGFVDAAEEERTIRQLQSSGVPLVLVTNRPTREFRQTVFGVDYHQHLMSWIEQNYKLCAVFGPRPDPSLPIGSSTFFIRGYCLAPARSPANGSGPAVFRSSAWRQLANVQ